MGKTIAVLMLAVWTVSPSVRADGRYFSCYLPWEDREVKTTAPALPPFKRSIVVRFPTTMRPATDSK